MRAYFEFQKNQTTFRTEILAGITTFLAVMYIIVVNPSILMDAGMEFSGVLTATVMVSAFSSIMMGIYAKNPIVLAPGMGLNAFFTYSVVQSMQVPWETALGAVFWSGVVFLLLSIFQVRVYIVKAIPKQLRYAVAAGIGLFITLIGFKNAGFLIADETSIIARGPLNIASITFLAGLAITAILLARRVKGAMILGIVITTLLAIPIGRWWGAETLLSWQGLFKSPDFSLLMRMDLTGSLSLSMIPVMFAFLFTDLFDTLSTFVGVAEAGKLIDPDGEPRNIRQSLVVDGFATTLSGFVGTSPTTSYIESATGIEQGGRSGLTAVVCGLLFLPFMFFHPLLSVIPKIATAPVLVLVGVFMMKPVSKINWQQFDDAIPCFLALILIPLTNSITQGIIWGFLSWTVVKLFTGERKEISVTLLLIDIFCIFSLIVH